MCKALEDMKKEAVDIATKKVTEEMVINFLKAKVDVAIISEATKLSIEEVKAIEKTLFETV